MSYNGFSCNLKLSDGRKVAVRRLAAGDETRLKAFFEALSPESWSLFHPHRFDEAAIARQVAKATDGTDWSYLALDKDVVAAYFFLWNVHDPVPMLGIGIGDAWQNGALGHQLMDILIADATILGRDGIKLTTLVGNKRAFHLYEKKGFVHTGDVETVSPEGNKHMEHAMVLDLKK
jgi:ribosomal protein S18 acetylase RimI-like enzyme